ncbi:uncharacterized protein LOC144158665 [Haemaphysalis longicornis]
MGSYVLTVIFGCALALAPRVADAQGDTGVCNAVNVYRCYQDYTSLLFRKELKPQTDGSYNETAYDLICSDVSETSPCMQAINNCPQGFQDQFKRSEGGYGAIRSIVCNKDEIKGFVRIASCIANEKTDKCVGTPRDQPVGSNPRDYWCKFSLGSLKCIDESLQDCKRAYEHEKPIFIRYFRAVSNVYMCDRTGNGSGSTAASHAIVFGVFGFVLTQWKTSC